MADNGLIIKIGAESKEFSDEIDKIKKKTEDLSDGLGEIAKVSGVVFAGLIASAGLAVHAFADAEKSSKLLVISLQNQGIASDELIERYKKLADQISEKTGIDDDAIIKGTAMLQNFLGQTEATGPLIQGLVDLSEKTGSLESAAEILGRGIQGNTRGLKQFGIEIDDTLTKEERIAKITEIVGQKFGGLAENANQGLGSFRGLQTAFGNFLEQIGSRLAPVVTEVVIGLTNFFNRLNENKPLLDFIFEVGKIAAIVAGVVTSVATAALTIVKLQQAFAIAQAAVTAFGLASKIAIGATGIGLLLIVIGEVAVNWDKIWPVLVGVYQTFVDNISELTGALGDLLAGVFTFNPAKIKSGLSAVQEIINEGFSNIKAASQQSADDQVKTIQDPRKAAAAQKEADRQLDIERRKQATIRAENELASLNAEQASNDAIELKKKEVELLKQIEDEKFKNQRELLVEHLAEVTRLQDDQDTQDEAKEEEFNNNTLANQDAYQKLSAERKQLFLLKNQQALQASLDTQATAQEKFALQQLQNDIAGHNKFLLEQQKYGTAFATINKAINEDEVKGFAQGVSQLTQLQQSKNATLKAIGKAAAIADITIKTAQSAVSIYQGFSVIPFVGPALGIAGAAAAVAFGAEQISNVLAAQSGGVVPGFNTGGDSVPSILQAGELVVPRSNFSEVVDAVADRRSQESTQATSGVSTGGGGSGSDVRVSLQFSGDNAEKFLTARQVEARSLGTLRQAPA